MTQIFELPSERTEYTDEIFGVLGRGLTYVTKFERDSKTLNSLFRLKSNPMESGRAFDKFATKLATRFDHALAGHLDEIVQFLQAREVLPLLGEARRLRNWLAHEASLGIEARLDVDGERPKIISEIRDAVETVAHAHLIILLMVATQTHEQLPSTHFLREFPSRIVKWVCEVEFD